MLKSGLRFLFGTFTQLIAVIVSYEFFFKYALTHGGIGEINSIGAIQPLIWTIIVIELIISICLLTVGVIDKSNHELKINK